MALESRHTPNYLGQLRCRASIAGKITASVLAVMAAAAFAIVLGSTPGTLALWNQSAPIADGGTITVGSSIDLSIAAGLAAAPQGQIAAVFPQDAWSGLLPGDLSGAELTVTNQGSVPVQLSAALDAQSIAQGQVSFSLSQGQCQQDAPSGTALTSGSVALAGPVLAAKTSVTYCLQAALSTTAPASLQGTQIISNFVLSLDAAKEATV